MSQKSSLFLFFLVVRSSLNKVRLASIAAVLGGCSPDIGHALELESLNAAIRMGQSDAVISCVGDVQTLESGTVRAGLRPAAIGLVQACVALSTVLDSSIFIGGCTKPIEQAGSLGETAR